MISSPPNLEHAGWLSKKGEKGLATWKKRWFLLKENHLYYHRKQGDTPLGIISLKDASRVAITDGDNRRFDITTPVRVYHLGAESETEAEQWVKILNNSRVFYSVQSSVMQPEPEVVPPSPSRPIEAAEPPVMMPPPSSSFSSSFVLADPPPKASPSKSKMPGGPEGSENIGVTTLARAVSSVSMATRESHAVEELALERDRLERANTRISSLQAEVASLRSDLTNKDIELKAARDAVETLQNAKDTLTRDLRAEATAREAAEKNVRQQAESIDKLNRYIRDIQEGNSGEGTPLLGSSKHREDPSASCSVCTVM